MKTLDKAPRQSHVKQEFVFAMQNIITGLEEFPADGSNTRYLKHQRYIDVLTATFARTMRKHDPSLLVHSRQVAELAEKLAVRLGLTEYQVRQSKKAGFFHDIGKLAISQSILSKPASPSLKEYEVLKKHPEMGVSLLQKCPEFEMLVPFVRYHHEAYNGRGYPAGLAGEQIPTEARIIAVAETIDSMLSDQPYRKACTVQQVIDELERCSGTQYDPLIVETAIDILLEIEKENIESEQRAAQRNTG